MKSSSDLDVKGFLSRFHSDDNVDTVFTNGCCYWFSYILRGRFSENGAKLMYDQIANHFGTEIDGRVYDVTGDVSEDYSWEPWDNLSDDLLKKRIIRDCVNF